MKSYRPISNLTFLGKLVERVVLNEHMTMNDLHTPQQSAYKKYHSTESILIKITNDVLIAADNKTATVLMLLDLSAAFDTVDHDKILSILESEIGVKSTALKWFKSFLVGRCQRTRIGQTVSEIIVLLFGVPQGSVLGPVLFNIYIRSLYIRIKRSGFNVQGYADDHQVYKRFDMINQVKVLNSDLIDCFNGIQKWMAEYYLQLNPGKTQIMILGPSVVLKELQIHGVQLTEDNCIRFVSTTKNLGILFDSSLSMTEQIQCVKRDSFKMLRKIRKLRFLFTEDQIKLIVTSLVVCKLDYCNGMYLGNSEKDMHQLQLIQNASAKTVFGLYKHDHVGNSLLKLHWLPVKYRIIFKILLIVFKCLNSMGPEYLKALLYYTNFTHQPLLHEYKAKTHFGDRAFQCAAPKLWNTLPKEIKTCTTLGSFKSSLKTHLFKMAFSDINQLE